ncbi:hypothetical protein D9619_010273 [Psilocybe cf. subviscida]|uniref:Uncharacterized protein n=1 Tax=Psilocybe cf. subviscida TaxID=2480587 RepID=A0A8H5ERZ9_9AGAR|nr:hypothetical protein D9619_010273 [Psilocybe cf. subviscida]
MGQYWLLFNLDKSEYSECGGAKMGELFYNVSETWILNLLLSGQPNHDVWGGDRIVLLGDYSQALPPNTVADDDSAVLKKCVATDQSKSSQGICAYDTLRKYGKEKTRVTRTSSLLHPDTVYALRSHEKKEYVRRDVVRDYRKFPESCSPGLAQALFTLVGWSEDPSAALMYNDDDYIPASGGTTVPLHRGAWAGNRIDIVALTDEVQKSFDEEGWVDISEEKARHVSDVYACDDY